MEPFFKNSNENRVTTLCCQMDFLEKWVWLCGACQLKTLTRPATAAFKAGL
jgi:hypothetical protein